MESFPPNRKTTRQEPKKVERVTSADARRRKKPLGKQFKATFFSGDARTAFDYVVIHVIVPAIRDTLFEAGQSVIEKLIYGEARSRRRGPMGGPPSGPQGYVAYNRRPDEPPAAYGGGRMISRSARARHDFDDIVLESRRDAEEVLDRMYDLLSNFEMATVAELYELTGIQSSHTDNKWGWTDLRGASVSRVRTGGYLLNLPDPEPLG